MEVRKMNEGYVLRLDPGDEVISCLMDLARRENIHLACVSGLGAAGNVTIGIFRTGEKQYFSQTYQGDFEIASLCGNLTRMDGEPYLHLHITIGNPITGEVHAGHLSRAVISATSEIFLQIWSGEVGRKFSEKIGLNLFEF